MNIHTKIYAFSLISAAAFFASFGESSAATVSASDCSYSSVSAAVASAAVGDKVTVPAGSCTWSSTLNINKGITLMGAGIGKSVIKKGTGTIINYTPSNPQTNALIRISGFTFDMNNSGGTGISVSSGNTLVIQTKLRIDNNRFQNIPITSTQDHYILYSGMRGVIDSNVFGRVFYPFRSQGSPINLGAPNYGGGAEWNHFEGVVFGKSDNNVVFEDNVFEELTSGGGGVAMTDCQGGQRYLFRYNSINITGSGQSLFDMHGNQGSSFYSCMGGELYGNNITGGGGTLLDHRGGRAFAFNNKAASGMSIQVREEFDDAISPVSYVGPNAPQYSQQVSGSYYWGNIGAGSPITVYLNTTCSQCSKNGLKENVNFWQGKASFDGTSGIGSGTLASRPKTCTKGVGYWATNQSTTNLTGMVGAKPTTPISGTLYRCVATNTWDSGASLLPYPHPLRSGDSVPSSGNIAILPPFLHQP